MIFSDLARRFLPSVIRSHILVWSIVLVGSSPSGAADFYKDIVPNSDTALRIAEAVFEAYYGKEEFLRMTRNSPLVAELEGDNWLVFSYPKQKGENKKPGEINVTAGGGKPSVMISKKNGEIINIYLSR